jgi:probable rRNA maturation factor
MAIVLHFNRLDEWPDLRDQEARLRRAARAALRSRGREEGEVSYTFVTVDEIRSLNREYLGRDLPTDVIAFDLGDGSSLLGDIYLSPEVAAENATAHGEEEGREVLRLVVHGSLHVTGMEHPEGENRMSGPMFVLQEELLRSLAEG